jgi:hypothetical protein
LAHDAAGNFYGTAQAGASEHLGTAFQLTLSHVFVALHTFLGNWGGAFPNAGLFRDGAVNLYGHCGKGLCSFAAGWRHLQDQALNATDSAADGRSGPIDQTYFWKDGQNEK